MQFTAEHLVMAEISVIIVIPRVIDQIPLNSCLSSLVTGALLVMLPVPLFLLLVTGGNRRSCHENGTKLPDFISDMIGIHLYQILWKNC